MTQNITARPSATKFTMKWFRRRLSVEVTVKPLIILFPQLLCDQAANKLLESNAKKI